MLALTGCGDDGGGGTGGSGASGGSGGGGMSENLTNALNAWCMKLVDCYSDAYPDYTVQECLDYVIDDYNLDGISAECDAAATSYFECGAQLVCDELLMLSNECDPEFNAAGDVCS